MNLTDVFKFSGARAIYSYYPLTFLCYLPIWIMSTRNKAVPQKQHSPIERVFDGVLRGFKHHTNPVNHTPIHVEPIDDPLKRTGVAFAGAGMLVLGGIGAVTPIMPTWPFVLVGLFCFARTSSRVRNWLVNNHVIKSMMSLIGSRPERPFVWAQSCITWISGVKESKKVNE